MQSFDASPETSMHPTVAERLYGLIDIARRRWLMIIFMVTVAAAAAALVAIAATEQYKATAKVLLSDSAIIGSPDPETVSTPADPERDVNTKIGLIKLGTVANRVKARLNLKTSQDALTRKVSATLEGTTNIVDVTATDRSPTRAAAIANGFADEYVAFRERVARSTVLDALERVRRLLASLSPADQGSAQATRLASRMHELEIASAVQTAGARVVLRAPIPTKPTGPHPLTSAFLGALIGLILASFAAAVLEFRDRRIGRGAEAKLSDEEQLESIDDGELESFLQSFDRPGFRARGRADVG